MRMPCIIILLITIGLLHPGFCQNNDQWWKEILARAAARQSNKVATTSKTLYYDDPSVIDSETTLSAQTTSRPIKRSGQIQNNQNSDDLLAPFRQKGRNSDKQTRHSFKQKWNNENNKPIREKFIETEWDDDVNVPVNHKKITEQSNLSKEKVIKQTKSSSNDKFNDKTVRQSFKDTWNDNDEVVRIDFPVTDTKGWNNNNKNNHQNDKQQLSPAYALVWDSRNTPKVASESSINNKVKNNKSWSKSTKVTTTKLPTERPERISFDDETSDYYDNNENDGFGETPKHRTTLKSPDSYVSAKSNKINDHAFEEITTKKPATFGWKMIINHGTPESRHRLTTTAFTEILTTAKPKITTTKLKPTTRTTTTTTTTTTRTTTKPRVVKFEKLKSPANVLVDKNKQKQHRIGNWVDSDKLIERRNEDSDNYLREQEYDKTDYYNDKVEAAPLRSAERRRDRIKNEDYDNNFSGKLEDSIPGTPERDYPTYSTIPRTGFSCKNQEWPGYYADVEAGCQVFHVCQTGGQQNSFLCPNGTLFNQKVFVCDWWHNVQCTDSTDDFRLNANLYDYSFENKYQGNQNSIRRMGLSETNENRGIRRTSTTRRTAESTLPTTSQSTTETSSSDSSSDTEYESDDGLESESDSDSVDSAAAASVNNQRTGVESGKVYFDDEGEGDAFGTLDQVVSSSPLSFKSTRLSAQNTQSNSKLY